MQTGSVQQEQESSPLGVFGPRLPWVGHSPPVRRDEDPALDLCLEEEPGDEWSLGWDGSTPLSAAGPLLQFCTWGPSVPSQAGLCSQGGWVGRRVASLSMKKGSQLCPRLADPRPLLSQAWLGDGWLASSQQSVTQEEAALGPQTVKCQLQASGTRLA